ncbi:copia protein [Tanacetum coccineum]
MTSPTTNDLIGTLKFMSLTFKTKDEEYAMAVRDFKKFFTRRGRDPNHLIGECPKPPKDKNQRAFVEGSWSDSGEEDDELKIKRASRLKHIASYVFKNFVGMKQGFLSQKGSGVGRGMKEKQVLLADKSVEGSKHVNVVNARLESFPTISQAHGIQSSISNKENMNDVWYNVGTYISWNTWVKYGLVRLMLNSSTGILSFQISSMDGLDAMLENVNVLVWVKLHGVPVTAFGEDGLSAIATKLGNPLMLDSYTSDMNILWETGNMNDPYDDDIYEGQDIPDKIQDICDNLDIKVRGRKKR